jgi:hypothetical protein
MQCCLVSVLWRKCFLDVFYSRFSVSLKDTRYLIQCEIASYGNKTFLIPLTAAGLVDSSLSLTPLLTATSLHEAGLVKE